MKKLIILITILLYGLRSSAFTAYPDSSVQQSTSVSAYLDTLQQHLRLTTNDSLKSTLYTQIAAQYLNYDSITDKKDKRTYQDEAIRYTFLALHQYSRYHDTVGLRICFNNLAKVYRAQRKYSQAKWYILQSNTLSRAKNDIPNIMSSLIELAAIKMDIKDYSLAKGDLNEALALSKVNHYPKVESTIQVNYALLYSHLKDYTKEALAIKRHNIIEDSIRKAEEASLTAKIKSQDSVQSKKKVFTTASKKVYKTNYSKRIASL
jgi:tetratricopeptide (TPR) repeat protein